MNAMPISIHNQRGNPAHLTRAEIEGRKAAEIKMGELVLKPPYYLIKNRLAFHKWNELKKIYLSAGVTFITSSDNEFIGRYCERWAMYRRLQRECDNIPKECLKDKLTVMMKLKLLNDDLIEMEQHLFLTPLSKIRAIPRKAEKAKEKSELEKKGFGDL